MAELVDAYVSGAYIERCAGSTPVRGTLKIETLSDNQSVRVFLFPISLAVSTLCQLENVLEVLLSWRLCVLMLK